MRKLSCFIIIPSNHVENKPTVLLEDERRGLVEKPSGCKEPSDEDCLEINFDVVYKRIIKGALREVEHELGVKIDDIRGTDIKQAGNIIDQLMPHICTADITITDITTHNPNVFLEYGIRSAVKDRLNIIIGHESVELPFNIKTLRCISYSLDVDKAEKAKESIVNFVKEFINPQHNANPVIETSDDLIKRNVELYSGRRREQEILKAYESAPQLIADLTSFLMTNGKDVELKRRAFKFLEAIGEVLERDERGLDSAIAHYKMMTTIKGMKPNNLIEVYYDLIDVYSRSDETKQEAEEYLEKVKELEEQE